VNVADLQQLLAHVSKLLETAGAKAAPLSELAAFREGLAPFREHTLKKLNELLVQADAAARGEAPPRRAGRRSSGGTGRPDAESLVREVKSLYERATDPTVSEADINALAARLAPLMKDDLLSVAASIELKVAKAKTKDHIIGEIRQRILARKSAHQRAHLLGHLGEASAEPAPAAAGGVSPNWPGVPDGVR
jgi:hypothetical protein